MLATATAALALLISQPAAPAHAAGPHRGAQAADTAEAVDAAIVGSWGLSAPDTERQHGQFTAHLEGASFGTLVIEKTGHYRWMAHGDIHEGSVRPYTPKRGAAEGRRYWLVNDGRDDYYVTFLGKPKNRLAVYSAKAEALIAYGAPPE
jgi:hypothetical protein